MDVIVPMIVAVVVMVDDENSMNVRLVPNHWRIVDVQEMIEV